MNSSFTPHSTLNCDSISPKETDEQIGDLSRTHIINFNSKIVCGDSLEILKYHPREIKYDVIIVDPPYNIKKDFGICNDDLPMQEYVNWSLEWLNYCLSLLSPNGLLYIYGYAEILAHIAVTHPVENQRWLVWHYTNKTVPRLKFWQRSHESILCLWQNNQARPNLEIDQIREPYTDKFLKNAAGKKRKATPSRYGARGDKNTIYVAHSSGALPRDVISIPALAGGAGASERWFLCKDCGRKVFSPKEIDEHREHDIFKHPTQKPMKLTERLLKSRINNKMGRVLIPFAGSGSECIVAEQLGIEYLGIEINPEYVEFANKWRKAYV